MYVTCQLEHNDSIHDYNIGIEAYASLYLDYKWTSELSTIGKYYNTSAGRLLVMSDNYNMFSISTYFQNNSDEPINVTDLDCKIYPMVQSAKNYSKIYEPYYKSNSQLTTDISLLESRLAILENTTE